MKEKATELPPANTYVTDDPEIATSEEPRVGIPHDFVAEMSGINPDELLLRASPLKPIPEVVVNPDHFISKQS